MALNCNNIIQFKTCFVLFHILILIKRMYIPLTELLAVSTKFSKLLSELTIYFSCLLVNAMEAAPAGS